MKKIVLVILGLIIFGLVACSGSDSKISDRLTTLETEVKSLKVEALDREKDFREELILIRKNLEGIRDILKMDKGRAEALDQPEDEKEGLESDLNAKAKLFVNKSLDRLLEITKKLLDKMEREFDEQIRKQETPKAPEGDQI